MSASTSWVECEFETRLGTLRGKRWGSRGGRPVLALHGWLDNCASFDTLAPQLDGVDLVALDMAGHVESYFRGGHGPYNIWQDLHDIHAVLDELSWSKVSFLAHSRGAMAAFLYAGCYPEKVDHLALIDALSPAPHSNDELPKQLRSAIDVSKDTVGEKKNSYESFAEACTARMKGVFRLSEQDARLLAQRGVLKAGERYVWRYDPKLQIPSEIKLSGDQIKAFIKHINVPILMIVASEGIVHQYAGFLNELKELHPILEENIEGSHHLHLSEKTNEIAERINIYFSEGE